MPVDTYQRYWDVSNIKLSSCFTTILKSTSWSRSPPLYQQDCVQDNTKYLSFFYGQTSKTYSKYTYCHNVFAALWKPSCVSYKENTAGLICCIEVPAICFAAPILSVHLYVAVSTFYIHASVLSVTKGASTRTDKTCFSCSDDIILAFTISCANEPNLQGEHHFETCILRSCICSLSLLRLQPITQPICMENHFDPHCSFQTNNCRDDIFVLFFYI